MKQERNMITMNEYGKIHFPIISNNVWMTTNELIELFGITYPTLKANIKAIYKSGILNEYETQRYIKLPNGYNVDVYSLPLIITLSFRLNTLGAYKMREYIIIKLTSNPRTDIVFMNVRTHECMNESKWEHN
ncbi:MAG: hypothetical protein OSJ56_08415 [Prevotella sp.]|uniref:hypothetical protein n=1 Tax=Prevotella sp. PTAC TaxID=2736295 RepID=UPI0015581C86|nr:hypothetical protein [Prevotella sp. PTAC]MCX4294065.1 hypothetical protein [Prevotella sp.]NPD55450.1 hypothetical protein [Prevotella sp. PTAC]